MKRNLLTLAALAFLVLLGHPPIPAAHAAHIPEPATIFYGRVVEHYPQRDFLVTQGEVVWTLRSPALAKEYRVRTRLRPLPGGQFSYQLRIPHQVLAFDLTVASKALPLAGGALAMEHVSISLDGQPLTLVAPAVDGFSAEQANRARAYRIDLRLTTSRPDTDGDGFPDWWEDANGYDKWDPADGELLAQQGFDPAAGQPAPASTFAQWRAAHFPGDTTDLNLFARVDSDGDAIVNLLEYAFGLDPKNPNHSTEALGHLPRGSVGTGHLGLRFRKNPAATDLRYTIETSEDLIQWSPAGDRIEALDLPADQQQAGWVSVRWIQRLEETPHRMLRVRVELIP